MITIYKTVLKPSEHPCPEGFFMLFLARLISKKDEKFNHLFFDSRIACRLY